MRTLDVGCDAEPLHCRTGAQMQPIDLDPTRLFELPKVLQEAGCPAWIRGVAVLGPPSGSSGEPSSLGQRLGLWIDLKLSARGEGHATRT